MTGQKKLLIVFVTIELFIVFFVSINMRGNIQAASYNIYFGNLHSHTEYSDGSDTPAEAFDYAKSSGVGDVLAVTDHADQMVLSEWEDTKIQADNYTDDTFVSIAGFEFTTDSGDLNTYNTEWFKDGSFTTSPTEYYDYIAANRPGSIIQWNHPSSRDGGVSDYSDYNATRDGVVHLLEVVNRSKRYESSYFSALDFGWHIGPAAGQDNHSADWLTGYETRTAVLAPSLTRANIYDAIRAHRVYATENRNLEISYQINGSIMGSIIPADVCNVSIHVEDPDTTISNDKIKKIELIKDGGIVEATQTTDAHSVVWTPIIDPCSAPYYFVRITNAADEMAWTAPIWITEIEYYTLTVDIVGSGVITPGVGLHTYPSGEVITLTAQPDVGWTFDGWSGDLSGDDNPATITMDTDKIVTATFDCVPITGLDFSFDPASPRTGQSVSFFATVTGGVAPFTYTWDFDDGTILITSTTTVAHYFPLTNTIQSYTTTLTATTTCSSQALSKPVTVTPWMIYLPVVMRTAETYTLEIQTTDYSGRRH